MPLFVLHCSNVCRTDGFWPKGAEPIGEQSFKEFNSQNLETLVEKMTCFINLNVRCSNGQAYQTVQTLQA